MSSVSIGKSCKIKMSATKRTSSQIHKKCEGVVDRQQEKADLAIGRRSDGWQQSYIGGFQEWSSCKSYFSFDTELIEGMVPSEPRRESGWCRIGKRELRWRQRYDRKRSSRSKLVPRPPKTT